MVGMVSLFLPNLDTIPYQYIMILMLLDLMLEQYILIGYQQEHLEGMVLHREYLQ